VLDNIEYKYGIKRYVDYKKILLYNDSYYRGEKWGGDV